MAEVAMRAIECACGEHVDGRNDTAMLDAFRDHVQAEHQDWSEADMKAYFVRNAYDVPADERA